MRIYYNIDEIPFEKNTILTVGTFDGVHLGHQRLLAELKKKAELKNGRDLVITFEPHPREVLFKNNNFRILTTINEKIKLIEELNIRNLLIIRFDSNFAELKFDLFIKEFLVEKTGITEFIIGHDHQFGKNREGNKNSLISLGKIFNFEVHQVEEFSQNGIPINSTRIREIIHHGDITIANDLLNRKYSFSGKVVEGRKIGRTLGFPTANIESNHNLKLLPKQGVYLVEVSYKGMKFNGMMNIGYRPTVSDEINLVAEVNIFDFDKDIYGDDLEVFFIKRIRDEKKFNSLDDLKEQLNLDKKRCLEIIKFN